MPIYEYFCKSCNTKSEVMQKMQDKPVNSCPKCNSSLVEKVISASSFQLKGTGWYQTDFKHK